MLILLLKRMETAGMGDVDRKRKLREIDARLTAPMAPEEELRRTWGMTPDAIAEQASMQNMLGIN